MILQRSMQVMDLAFIVESFIMGRKLIPADPTGGNCYRISIRHASREYLVKVLGVRLSNT